MKKIKRFSASIEPDILEKLDSFKEKNGIESRSDALRILIREEILSEEWKKSTRAYGVITMLYNHHGRETLQHIIQVQHDSKVKIIVSQHIHITHDMCLEIITVHGSPPELERLTAALGSIKGVKRASLARAAIAEELK